LTTLLTSSSEVTVVLSSLSASLVSAFATLLKPVDICLANSSPCLIDGAGFAFMSAAALAMASAASLNWLTSCFFTCFGRADEPDLNLDIMPETAVMNGVNPPHIVPNHARSALV